MLTQLRVMLTMMTMPMMTVPMTPGPIISLLLLKQRIQLSLVMLPQDPQVHHHTHQFHTPPLSGTMPLKRHRKRIEERRVRLIEDSSSSENTPSPSGQIARTVREVSPIPSQAPQSLPLPPQLVVDRGGGVAGGVTARDSATGTLPVAGADISRTPPSLPSSPHSRSATNRIDSRLHSGNLLQADRGHSCAVPTLPVAQLPLDSSLAVARSGRGVPSTHTGAIVDNTVWRPKHIDWARHSRHNRQQRAQIFKQLPTAAPGISKVTPNTIRQRQLARGKGLASDFKHFLGSAKSSTSNVLARLGPRRRPDQEQL